MLNGLKIESLSSWLSADIAVSSDEQYRHNLIKENLSGRAGALAELKPLIQKAHDDARFRLRKFLRDDLDPLKEWDEDDDPAEGYPEVFDLTTLKGYFGEFFSGFVAENFAPFGERNWRVPVFLFRFHETAFDQLAMWHQTGQMNTAIVGRTGDDCLAFVLENGKIVKILFLEAKCTASHSSQMIAEAHKKISNQNQTPVELMRLVDLLQAYRPNPEADVWITALRQLYRAKEGFERFDCVSYVCGQSPQKPRSKVSWISRAAPHQNYRGGRKLEAIEVQLSDVEDLVRFVYGKEA